QLLLGLELRVVGPDLGENVVPEDHVVLHRIRLGRARDLLMSVRAYVRAGGSPATVTLTGPATSIPLACVFEGVAHDSLRSLAGEDNRLDSVLIGFAAAQESADPASVSLGFLSHADLVDVGLVFARVAA